VNPADPLETWLVKCIDVEAGSIDIDIDRSTAWLAERTAAAAAKAKKKEKQGGPLDDGDYVGAILAGRPLDMGELVDTRDGAGGGDGGYEHVMEFMDLIDAEEDEAPHDPLAGVPGVPGVATAASTDGDLLEADMVVAGVDDDFVVDHDFIDEIAAIGASRASGSSSSGSSGTTSIVATPAAETLPELLARLKLAHKNDSDKFPRDVLNLDGPRGPDGQPPGIGKMYFVWSKTVKGVCRCHKSCALMLNTSWFSSSSDAAAAAVAAQRVTYEWLARGPCTSEHDHFSESKRLVQRYRPV